MKVLVEVNVALEYDSETGIFNIEMDDDEIIEAVRDDFLTEPTELLIGGTWTVNILGVA